MTPTLTFDESAADYILDAFGKEIDDDEFVVDSEKRSRETTEHDTEIQKEHFAGLEEGSIIFLDDDFNTLVEHVKRRSDH